MTLLRVLKTNGKDVDAFDPAMHRTHSCTVECHFLKSSRLSTLTMRRLMAVVVEMSGDKASTAWAEST
jgi:hypothetical protein